MIKEAPTNTKFQKTTHFNPNQQETRPATNKETWKMKTSKLCTRAKAYLKGAMPGSSKPLLNSPTCLAIRDEPLCTSQPSRLSSTVGAPPLVALQGGLLLTSLSKTLTSLESREWILLLRLYNKWTQVNMQLKSTHFQLQWSYLNS
jgi:hypothetical protein